MKLRVESERLSLDSGGRCAASKHGQFNLLCCVLPVGHAGEHNFVVAGVEEYRPAHGRRARRDKQEKQP